MTKSKLNLNIKKIKYKKKLIYVRDFGKNYNFIIRVDVKSPYKTTLTFSKTYIEIVKKKEE